MVAKNGTGTGAMAGFGAEGAFHDAITGWRGASPEVRARLLQTLCASVRTRTLLGNSLTLLLVFGLIIAETREPAHAVWVAVIIGAGALPRWYAARLRRAADYDQGTERKATTFLAISGLYGLLWGLGPFLFLPTLDGALMAAFLFVLVFGTVMGAYAPLPGILYVRFATTGVPTLVAIALHAPPRVTALAVVVATWLVLRLDIWRGYHRTLRRQFEMQATLENRHTELETANRARDEDNYRLQRMAETDPLTGAANRRLLVDRLQQLAGRTVALVVFDIDRFKAINDRFGHPVGDAVLVEVVAQARKALRSEDLIARTGGEEFAIVLPDLGPDDAHALAERVRRGIQSGVIAVGDEAIRVTLSLGVATADARQSGVSTGGLLQAADAALYRAKAEGRNRTHLAPSDSPSEALEKR